MKSGDRFGRLIIQRIIPGRKSVHPKADCRCDCGGIRTARLTDLRTGKATSCSRCSAQAAWERRSRNSPEERTLLAKESDYRCQARRRGHEWALSRERFRDLVGQPCTYCGSEPAEGIDRADNVTGYTEPNSVPCCSICNFAKRDMSVADFLDWVRRVAKKNPA